MVNYEVKRTTWTNSPGSVRFTGDLPTQQRPVVGFHLEGECPTCSDPTIGVCPVSDFNLPLMAAAAAPAVLPGLGAVAAGAVASGMAVAQDSNIFSATTTVCVMTCRCAEVHPLPPPPPKNPSDPGTGLDTATPTPPALPGYGCGSSWLVEVKYRRLKREIVSIEPVASNEAFKYWQAANGIAAAAPDSLTKIQAIAGKWQTALTAMLGLLSVTALIGGRDTLEKLDSTVQTSVGRFALVSVIASVVAIMAFAYANAGAPQVKPLNGPDDLVNADLRPLREAWWSTVSFYSAFAAAAVSLIAVCFAVHGVWFGKAAKSPEEVELVVPKDKGSGTDSLCGSIKIDATGNVKIKPGANGAKASTYPASEIVSIGTC